jgi:hypothetical protein
MRWNNGQQGKIHVQGVLAVINEMGVGLGTGRFWRVSACSATRPVPIGFGQFQPAVNSKNSKFVGYSGRTDRVARGRVGRAGWSGWK